METLTFTCKIITPMFLAGADGQTPELRAASIKGALRFWWRACNGHLGLEEMRKKEQEIFGGVGNDRATRSKVVVRVAEEEVKIGRLPNSTDDKKNNPGIHYLWYTVGMNNRSAIWEGTFRVILSAHDPELLKSSAMCFWLLSHLGGLGTRARRGGGSFSVERIDGNLSFDFLKKSTENTEEFLRDRLVKISTHFHFTFGFDTQSPTEFIQLSNAQIHIAELTGSHPLVALEKIGREFQKFRHLRQPDYDTVKNFITSGNFNGKTPRTEFGLPLMFRFRSLRGLSASIQGSNKIDRSASGLLISVIKWDGEYRPVLANFVSKLLPDDEKLVIKSKGNSKRISQPYQGIKETFISELSTIQLS